METPQKSDTLTMVERRPTDSAQHTKKDLRKENPYYYEAQRPQRLKQAWNAIYQNGIQSTSRKIKDGVRNFRSNEDSSLRKIYKRLHQEEWEFERQFGAPKKRPGKQSRPIVIYPIPNSIVQRSILDVLQASPLIHPYYETKTSFGGIKNRSVRQAIEAALKAIRRGSHFYIRSDIRDFFSNVPREAVISKVRELLNDEKFISLLTRGTDVELINIKTLKADAALYPTHEIGIAQGCCLSPLMGNILLSDFDAQMNDNSVTCLRYIDDFIILGPTLEAVSTAFKKANTILKNHRLSAYSPFTEKAKADVGNVSKGFEFLGCFIKPFIVSPSKKSRRKILKRIEDELAKSLKGMKKPGDVWQERESLADTLVSISNILEGWGNQYSFCSDRHIFRDMDKQVDKCLEAYLWKYKSMYGGAGEKDRRRILGVHLLEDSNCSPIS